MVDRINMLKNVRKLNGMTSPCKLRRSTQCCFDCRWCGSSRQEYNDKVCDNCDVSYDLRLFFEPFGNNGLRVFGDFARDKNWFELISSKNVFEDVFEPLGGELDTTSLGWVFKDEGIVANNGISKIRNELIKHGIFNWYSNSEISARVKQESEIGVDI